MRHAAGVMLLVVIGMLGTWYATANADEAADAPRWAYKVVAFHHVLDEDFSFRGRDEEYQQLEEHLSRLGEEGWELVTTDETMLIFKRPLR
ncbi:hypothetical protein ACERK3_02975 [Phycisphaerales bacterium AB-hyl4]|uniref:DUF4177 domain-containing protein n=1 Tax=Natronomicrosphaera hydrolytica TaxID=3242702 RepID=A0ABV4U319_9BACT